MNWCNMFVSKIAHKNFIEKVSLLYTVLTDFMRSFKADLYADFYHKYYT